MKAAAGRQACQHPLRTLCCCRELVAREVHLLNQSRSMQAAWEATTAKTWPTWAGLEQAAHVCNSLAGIALIFQISEGMHPDLLHN